ncbi:hypothetical protein BT96DRAFT_912272 [Gymnopus androsaceus JB14]|uniref:Trypsin-like serine protease n=1 Tax=Gymnopus androsaceus JB14 TaxID=1447944 RepID=A0A6A4IEV8_9AGAR|nr:hypothetical protein BT96DRAFT_912272 [Gymnopus androsaceus JB14]
MFRRSGARLVLPLLTRNTCPSYATVSPSLLNPGLRAPPPPEGAAKNVFPSISSTIRPPNIVCCYTSNSGHVLGVSLLYESRPSATRKVNRESTSANNTDVLLVAHCVQDGDEHKVTVASGFALEAPSQREGESLILTCAHTFEEIRRSPLMLKSGADRTLDNRSPRRVSSGSFVMSSEGSIYPVTEIVSCLPRSDLMILSCKKPPVATLPVSPYPVHPETRVLGHLVSHEPPSEAGWSPWIENSWSKWVRGTVLGYRDFAGRETMPGTYDALSHLLFSPLPTAGSSGGPIIDEETGAVIGVMLGTRMYSRVEGTRGWGVPSETIFEMFSLPGLEGKK